MISEAGAFLVHVVKITHAAIRLVMARFRMHLTIYNSLAMMMKDPVVIFWFEVVY